MQRDQFILKADGWLPGNSEMEGIGWKGPWRMRISPPRRLVRSPVGRGKTWAEGAWVCPEPLMLGSHRGPGGTWNWNGTGEMSRCNLKRGAGVGGIIRETTYLVDRWILNLVIRITWKNFIKMQMPRSYLTPLKCHPLMARPRDLEFKLKSLCHTHRQRGVIRTLSVLFKGIAYVQAIFICSRYPRNHKFNWLQTPPGYMLSKWSFYLVASAES